MMASLCHFHYCFHWLNQLLGRWHFKWVNDTAGKNYAFSSLPTFLSSTMSLPNASRKEGAMLTLSGWPRPTLTAHISHSALFQVAAYARLLNFNPGKGGQLRKEKHVRDCAGGLLGKIVACWGWSSSEISFSSLSAPSLGVVMQVLI